jgi:hypothetical protein
LNIPDRHFLHIHCRDRLIHGREGITGLLLILMMVGSDTDDVSNTGSFSWRVLSEALPEGITRWENVCFKIIIGSHRADSEFFTIAH